MHSSEPTDSREDQAMREVGHTGVSPALARVMTGLFLLVLVLPPLVDQIARVRDGEESAVAGARHLLPTPADLAEQITEKGVARAFTGLNRQTLRRIQEYERDLEDNSVVTETLIPPVQRIVVGKMRAGTESVYCGRDGWLFYRPGIDYLSGPGFLEPQVLAARTRSGDETTAPPQPNPLDAIIDFRDRLAARDIALVVMPAPDKASIYPEYFSRRYAGDTIVQNSSYESFLSALDSAGVIVCDPAPALVAAKMTSGEPLFLATDTHWSPRGLAVAADSLATVLRAHSLVSLTPARTYARAPKAVVNAGDMLSMLSLPDTQTEYPPEAATIERVEGNDGTPWEPDPAAEILLLGDSFSNIYTLDAMGWGAHAGLPAQLSVTLQAPVDALLRNDAGAHATREELGRRIARGEDRLAGKRVVVWEFATRELAQGDWKTGLPLEASEAPVRDGNFAGRVRIRARVAAVTRPPAPGSVPYKDCVVALHLVDVKSEGGVLVPTEMVVFTPGMRNSTWTEAARYEADQYLAITASPWVEVESTYGSWNRVDFTDPDVVSLPAYWSGPDVSADSSETVVEIDLELPQSGPDPPQRPGADRAEPGATVWEGENGWLFFPPEVQRLARGDVWVAGPTRPPDTGQGSPMAAILDFHRQLVARDIALVLLPIPPKALIHARDALGTSVDDSRALAQQALESLETLYDELRTAGVNVIDLAPLFVQGAESGEPYYCKQDTHWNGRACAVVSALIADHVRAMTDFTDVPRRTYKTDIETAEITGDLLRVLGDEARPRESVWLEFVRNQDGGESRAIDPWRDSPVLLLSDSHGLVFHAGGDMHASGAGLPDHLAKELGFPVDLVAVRGAGATAPRIELLRRGDDLAGKKVVIWSFSAREFAEAAAGWPLIPVVREAGSDPDTNNRRAEDIANEKAAIAAIAARQGGWDHWFESLRPLQDTILAQTEPESRILRGEENWLYHGLLAEYLRLPPTPDAQQHWKEQYAEQHPGQWIPHYDAARDSIVHISNQLKARDIDLIFVPIPQKAELYPEHILPTISRDTPVSPQRYRLMADLLEAGVETLDVLPALQQLKAESTAPLFSKSDIHWTNDAVRATADVVASRLQRYDFSHAAPVPYTLATEYRTVAIRPSLRQALDEETPAHEQEQDTVVEVLESDGRPYDYRVQAGAPVLLIGDSFMMGGHGGGSFAAHVAKALQASVQGHYQQNGGQQAPAALARDGGALLNGRRVVVWYTVAGMLGRHWPVVDLPAVGGDVSNPEKTITAQSPTLPPFGEPVFAFYGDTRRGVAYAWDGAPRAGAVPLGHGLARYDNQGAMILGKGGFVQEEGAAYAAERIAGAHGFTIEATLESFDLGREPRIILGLGHRFTIQERHGTLSLVLDSERGAIGIQLGTIAPRRKTHLIVSMADGRARCWKDGVPGVDVPIAASLSTRPGTSFVFGGSPSDDGGWHGKLYQFALRAGGVGEQEVAARYEQIQPWLETRTAPPSLRVEATLLRKSTVPAPEDIAPYTENLTVFEYAVDAITRGAYPIDRAYVVHWGVLNGNAVPWSRDVTPGTRVTLDLTRLAAHPELKSLNISQDVVSEYDRPVLFDVGALALGEPRAPIDSDTPLFIGERETPRTSVGLPQKSPDPVASQARSDRITRDRIRLEQMARDHGGWPAWLDALQPFRDVVRSACDPDNAPASDGALFLSRQGYLFQKTVVLPYFPDDWFDAAPGGTAPERAIRATNAWLAGQGIDLIVVPVPPRFEVTPQALAIPVPADALVSPQRLKFHHDLLRADVEMLDILPDFLAQQDATGESLSLQYDSHYTNAAVKLLADSLAQRLGRYGYDPPDPAANPYTRTPVEASLRVSPWRFLQPGSPIEIPKYEVVQSCEVHDRNGEPYVPDEASPVLVIGDSYSYVYQETAGHLPAQLAHALGMPIDHIGIGAGGPKVPEALLTLGTDRLAPKRVVIWVFTARYLTQPGWRNPFSAAPPP